MLMILPGRFRCMRWRTIAWVTKNRPFRFVFTSAACHRGRRLWRFESYAIMSFDEHPSLRLTIVPVVAEPLPHPRQGDAGERPPDACTVIIHMPLPGIEPSIVDEGRVETVQ